MGAAVLAAALMELFPEAQWISGGGTSSLFFGDILFPFPFKKEFIPLIEERMRLMGKEGRETALVEMVPSNAALLFKSQGQSIMAQEVALLQQATLSLYRIGQTYVYLPKASSTPKTPLPYAVQLFFAGPVMRKGKMVTRILGVWGDDKQEVKQQAKELSSLQFHEQLSSSLLAPLTKGWVWLPEGEREKEFLIDWIKAQWKKRGVSSVTFPPPKEGEKGLIENCFQCLEQAPHLRMGVLTGLDLEGEEEGFIAPGPGVADRAVFLCKEPFFEEELISSLQFILEIPKILGFESKIVVSVLLDAPKQLRKESLFLCEKALKKIGVQWCVEKVPHLPYLIRVEVQIKDALGRYWMGPFVGIPSDKCKDQRALFFSLCYSLERMAALLLEKHGCFKMRSIDSEPAN